MTKVAAIYARVSSDRQKENHTIASQVAALWDMPKPMVQSSSRVVLPR